MHDALINVKDNLVALHDKNLKHAIGTIDKTAINAIRRIKVSREETQDTTYHVKSVFLKPGLKCMMGDTISGRVDHIDLDRVGALQLQLQAYAFTC